MGLISKWLWPKKWVKLLYSSHIRATPWTSGNCTLIHAYLTSWLCFSICTGNKERLKEIKSTKYYTTISPKSQILFLTGQFAKLRAFSLLKQAHYINWVTVPLTRTHSEFSSNFQQHINQYFSVNRRSLCWQRSPLQALQQKAGMSFSNSDWSIRQSEI